MTTIDLTIRHQGDVHRIERIELPIHLGRQSALASRLHGVTTNDGAAWLALVNQDDRSVSRHALSVRLNDQESIELVNPHPSAVVRLSDLDGSAAADPTTLDPGQTVVLCRRTRATLPGGLQIEIDRKSWRDQDSPGTDVEASTADHPPHQNPLVSVRTVMPQRGLPSRGELDHLLSQRINEPDDSASTPREELPWSDRPAGDTAIALIGEVLTVVRKATHTDEFFEAALRRAAEMIGLDHASIMMREDEQWRRVASYTRLNDSFALHEQELASQLPSGSERMLHLVERDRQTVIFDAIHDVHQSIAASMPVERAVATPMLNDDNEVLGVLYGDRNFGQTEFGSGPLRPFELMLLEVMAGAVSAGLARQRQEDLRSSMDHFFSPEIVRHLRENTDLMKGREAEVSVLFCDVRGFSRVSESIGPEMTFRWINDLMTSLSTAVRRTEGVVVDYIGDELMAMWGAPNEQIDHADRACRAAALMLAMMQPLRQRWSDSIDEPFDFGIGIASGTAQVGNTGSRERFKYGPLGSVVNLASRVQGLTKHFGITAIATQQTIECLSESLRANVEPSTSPVAFRRLSMVRPIGMTQAVTMYQVATPSESFAEVRRDYETALDHFEASRFHEAASQLADLVHRHPDDLASLNLLTRTVEQMRGGREPFDPVYVAETK